MSKKDKIFEAALHLFVENGIERTPTAKIAAEAGVANGTLFHHFKNKEDLVNALYLEVKASIAQSMSRGMAGKDEDKDILRHIWDSFLEWSIKNPDLFRFNTLACESPVITRKTKQQMIGETFGFLSEFIKRAKLKESSRDLPFDFLAALSASVLTRTAQYFIDHPDAFDNPDIVDQAFDAYVGMLSKP